MSLIIQSKQPEGTCAICLNGFNQTNPPLTHAGPNGKKHEGFHQVCLKRLFDTAIQNQTAFTCPMCRILVNPYGTIYPIVPIFARVGTLFQKIRRALIHAGNRPNLATAIAAAAMGTALAGLPEIPRLIIKVAGMTILGGVVIRNGEDGEPAFHYYSLVIVSMPLWRVTRHRLTALAIGSGFIANEIFTRRRVRQMNQLIIGITMCLGAAQRIDRSRTNAIRIFSSVGFLIFGILALLPRR